MKKNKGITLISLIVTILVLMIIAGISVYSGKEIIKEAKLEELRTNMLLIQAKAKEYVEQASFKMGPEPVDAEKKENVRQEVYGGVGLEKATGITVPSEIPISECYKVTTNTLKLWGLDKIDLEEGEYYLIKFDETNNTAEIYNTLGINGKYSLTEIETIEE